MDMEELMNDADWQILCELHPVAMDRFCQRPRNNLANIQHLAKKLFPDFRRSDGLRRLASLRGWNLITDEEYALFSEGARQWVEEVLYKERNQWRL